MATQKLYAGVKLREIESAQQMLAACVDALERRGGVWASMRPL